MTANDSVFDPLLAEIQEEDQQKMCPRCGCCAMVRVPCKKCDKGRIWIATWTPPGGLDLNTHWSDCPDCNGTGFELCEWCIGTGFITSTSYLDIGGGQYQKMQLDMPCTHCNGGLYRLVCAGGCSTEGKHEDGPKN